LLDGATLGALLGPVIVIANIHRIEERPLSIAVLLAAVLGPILGATGAYAASPVRPSAALWTMNGAIAGAFGGVFLGMVLYFSR
jgi:hypothetical protein